jgi:hypothetical protein
MMGITTSQFVDHLGRIERARDLAERHPHLVLASPDMFDLLQDARSLLGSLNGEGEDERDISHTRRRIDALVSRLETHL